MKFECIKIIFWTAKESRLLEVSLTVCMYVCMYVFKYGIFIQYVCMYVFVYGDDLYTIINNFQLSFFNFHNFLTVEVN